MCLFFKNGSTVIFHDLISIFKYDVSIKDSYDV